MGLLAYETLKNRDVIWRAEPTMADTKPLGCLAAILGLIGIRLTVQRPEINCPIVNETTFSQLPRCHFIVCW